MLTEDKNKSLEHVEITNIEYISEIKRSYHIKNIVLKYVVDKSAYNLGVVRAYISVGVVTNTSSVLIHIYNLKILRLYSVRTYV